MCCIQRDCKIPPIENWTVGGIKTVVLRSKNTYVSSFKREIKSGKTQAKSKHGHYVECAAYKEIAKFPPIEKYKKSLGPDIVQYIGIANDEQERLLRLDGVNRISLLQKYQVTEDMAFQICRDNGLLSPIYDFTTRGGCFFCPNAKIRELRHLRDYHPDLWQRLLDLQKLPNKVTEKFNRQFSIDEIDLLLKNEDNQLSMF